MNRKAGQAYMMPGLRFLMVPPIRFERTTPALGERLNHILLLVGFAIYLFIDLRSSFYLLSFSSQILRQRCIIRHFFAIMYSKNQRVARRRLTFLDAGMPTFFLLAGMQRAALSSNAHGDLLLTLWRMPHSRSML